MNTIIYWYIELICTKIFTVNITQFNWECTYLRLIWNIFRKFLTIEIIDSSSILVLTHCQPRLFFWTCKKWTISDTFDSTGPSMFHGLGLLGHLLRRFRMIWGRNRVRFPPSPVLVVFTRSYPPFRKSE